MKPQEQVKEFHKALGCPVGVYHKPAISRGDLRARLIAEELKELKAAIKANDLVEAIDALCDILYVTYGAAVEWGLDLEPFFNEVHRTNMEKRGAKARGDGKILKPTGWKPPDIQSFLNAQRALWCHHTEVSSRRVFYHDGQSIRPAKNGLICDVCGAVRPCDSDNWEFYG